MHLKKYLKSTVTSLCLLFLAFFVYELYSYFVCLTNSFADTFPLKAGVALIFLFCNYAIIAHICLNKISVRLHIPAIIQAVLLIAISLTLVEVTVRSFYISPYRPSTTLIWEHNANDKVRYNSWGMSDKNFSTKRNSQDEMRFLVLGDSSAWGDFVTKEERFSDRLENKLTKAYPNRIIRVMNAAVVGYSTFQMKGAYFEKYLSIKPNCIILSTNSDWPCEGMQDEDRLKTKFLRPFYSFCYHMESFLFFRKTGIFNQRENFIFDYATDFVDCPRVSSEETFANMVSIAKEVQSRIGNGIPLIIMDMPLYIERFSAIKGSFHLDNGKKYIHPYKLAVKKASHNTNSVLLDGEELFKGKNKDKLFVDEVHPTAEGHRLLTDKLFEIIQNNNILNNGY